MESFCWLVEGAGMQIEWTAGCNPNQGIFRLAIFESGVETCSSSALVQNCVMNITHFSFDTLPEGGMDTASTVYIDEFSSFRTLAP